MVSRHTQAHRAASAADGNGGPGAALEQTLVTGVPEEGGRRSRLGIRRARSGVEAPLEALSRELARSRRYRRPLALIGIVSPQGARRGSADAAAAIRTFVRAVDSVWASAACVFVLLPESDRSDGEQLLARLRQHADAVLDGATTNIAVFPLDGLTAGALLEIANGRMAPALVEPPTAPDGGGAVQPTNGANQAPTDTSAL
jgi:hypothetical protein